MKKKLTVLGIAGICAMSLIAGCGKKDGAANTMGAKPTAITETTAEADTSAKDDATTPETESPVSDTPDTDDEPDETVPAEKTTAAPEIAAEPFVPDYSDYHKIVDTQYGLPENSDYNTYTLVDTNDDDILDLVLKCGDNGDTDPYTEIYTLTPDGIQLLETLEYPCDWLTLAKWVATIDDTDYERFLQ